MDAGSKVVKEKHLKIVAYQKGIRFDGIAFNMSDAYNQYIKSAPFDMCYSLEMNEFKGMKNLQLKVRDIRASV
jgi:single-stranded-DNA-specific exonuclease